MDEGNPNLTGLDLPEDVPAGEAGEAAEPVKRRFEKGELFRKLADEGIESVYAEVPQYAEKVALRYRGGNQDIRDDIAAFVAARPGFGETVLQQQKREAREAQARKRIDPELPPDEPDLEWAQSAQSAREHMAGASVSETFETERTVSSPHAVQAAIERRKYLRGQLSESDYRSRLSGNGPEPEDEPAAAASYMNLGQEIRGTKNRIHSPPPPGASVPLDADREPAAAAQSGGGRGTPKAPPILAQVPPPPPEAGKAAHEAWLAGEAWEMPEEMGAGAAAVAGGAIVGATLGVVSALHSPNGSIREYMPGGGRGGRGDSGAASGQALLAALNKIAGLRSRM